MQETEVKHFPRDQSAWYISAMESLVDVIEDLSQAHDLDTVMRIVRTAARNLTGADGATFVLRDDGKCYYADEDAISPLWKGQRFPMSSCISGWAMLNKDHVVIEDIYQDSRIPADAYRPTFVKSLTMVPIRQSDPIGAIGTYWAYHRTPSDNEIKILKTLANATSVAIENVELYTRLQKELQAVERTILDNTVEGIITVDAAGNIIRYNQACEKIFGYTKDDVLGQNIRGFIPAQYKAEFEHLFELYLSDQNKNLSGTEIVGQRKTGETFPAELSLSPIQIGKDMYISAIIRDISERKLAEGKLKDSEQRYELAVKGSNDGLWDWDIPRNKLYWSPRFKEMLGIGDEAFQPTYDEFKNRIHPDDRERIVTALEAHTRNGIPYDAEFRMKVDNADYIWVRASGASLRDKNGLTTRMSGSVSDIADRKAAEEKLQIAHEDADRANRAKSDFLAHMSHELRTPLNSIIGLNRILFEDRDMPGEQREIIGISYRSAQNLLEIVNDILDLSKIEADELELESIVFSLEEVVHNVIETLLPQASEKGLTLIRDFNADGLPYFIGDPLRLGRVLINLVGNAIKYTEKGNIHIHISSANAAPGKAIITGRVTDTGIGIAADKKDSIFGRFIQADTSITRRYGGTGLGLAITKEIVEKMGGTIGVDSVEGEGSTFWFEIPLPTAEIRPDIARKSFRREAYDRRPAEERIRAADLRLLVAEDHALNQAFMKKLLPRMGITQYTVVDNGQAAAEAAMTENYDMLLIDCHMPILSGYDATRKIRTFEAATESCLPIIAMTADAMIGTRERCLKSGMGDYITKPINQDELRYVMAQWVTFPDEEGIGKNGNTQDEHQDETIDFSILSQFSDTEEEMQNFVNLFLEQSAADMTTLEKNCTSGKNTSWMEAAHRLKGSTAMLGAEKLRGLCAKAQDMVDTTQEEREAILGQLRIAYNKVTTELRKAAQSSQ